MTIPTEPIGSIPRPLKLLEAINRQGSSHTSLEPLYEEAVRKTIEQFEATGSPVVTDGEQRKYRNFATYCVDGLPADNLPGHPREEFIKDLLDEHEKENRGCLAKGAHKVQIDFTEARLAVKMDPSGGLLSSFIELNNIALGRFSE